MARDNEKIFIDGILFGDFSYFADKRQTGETTNKAAFERTFGVEFYANGNDAVLIKENYGLYDYLVSHDSIVERLGVYYQSDVDTEVGTDNLNDPNNPFDNIPEANKDEKRVITYTIL